MPYYAQTRRPSTSQAQATSPSAAAAKPATPSKPPRDLIRELGLVGLSSIQPIVLASLATRSPLLLISTHGSAKSLLLERIAQALNLRWRHYNAALVNFDDLVGYPLPDDSGQLRYVQTPASVWGAQAVFIDEISRARMDAQNRLFPIIHERRVQGINLNDLQHRWAAMNPPSSDDGDDAAGGYLGSQPLDMALADRFAFHLSMPEWRSFTAEDQESLILAERSGMSERAPELWASALERTTELLPLVQAQWDKTAARHVRLLTALMDRMKLRISARRAGMLARNAIAVHAARLAADPQARFEDSLWLATLHSLPFAACTSEARHLPSAAKLLVAHQEAWRQAGARPDDPISLILSERDPARRIRLAMAAPSLPDGELTAVVTDALAEVPEGARHALAQWLLEDGRVQRLTVVASETVGEVAREVLAVQELNEHLDEHHPRVKLWGHTQRLIQQHAQGDGAPLVANLLVSLFTSGRVDDPAQLESAALAYRQQQRWLEVAA
jgi:MoxR-like ATPase